MNYKIILFLSNFSYSVYLTKAKTFPFSLRNIKNDPYFCIQKMYKGIKKSIQKANIIMGSDHQK